MLVDEGWGFLFLFILCFHLFVFSTALPGHSHVICPICISLKLCSIALVSCYLYIHPFIAIISKSSWQQVNHDNPDISISSNICQLLLGILPFGHGNLQMKVPSRHPDQMSEPLELVHFDAKEEMPTLLSILMSELIT